MKLTFYGGAGQVTGANYILEFDSGSGVKKIMIDCGLHQGSRFCEAHNYNPFAYPLNDIAAVFITHAHIDHTGRLPKLVKDGYTGPVYSTPPTRDFAELLLLDSEHLLAQEAEREHKPSIYKEEDVLQLMKQWKGLEYHQVFSLGPSARITLYSAGHILGSTTYLVEAEGKTIIFSGDLGNSPAPLIGHSECPTRADYCVMESAYGNRLHENLEQRQHNLQNVIQETIRNKGALMIPAFALERTQSLLLEIKDMLAKKKIPKVPIFIDSPLAIKLTTVYSRYREYFKEEVRSRFNSRESIFDFPELHMTMTTEDSKAINDVPNPKIIIAGNGMSQGGRILHHERRYLSDPHSTLLIFGYQAQGSLGRRLIDGATSVTLFGEEIPVRAHIRSITAYSAHADQRQLLEWVAPLSGSVKKVFLVQGEQNSAEVLASKIQEQFKMSVSVPREGESVVL